MKSTKLNPICPASTPQNKHGYSLKGLVTVHFTEEKNEKTGDMVRICPSCKKALSNGLKAMRKYSNLLRVNTIANIIRSRQALWTCYLQTLRQPIHDCGQRRRPTLYRPI